MTTVQTKTSILYPVIGAKQVSLWIAHDRGPFAKQGLEVTMIESLLNRSLPGREDMWEPVRRDRRTAHHFAGSPR